MQNDKDEDEYLTNAVHYKPPECGDEHVHGHNSVKNSEEKLNHDQKES